MKKPDSQYAVVSTKYVLLLFSTRSIYVDFDLFTDLTIAMNNLLFVWNIINLAHWPTGLPAAHSTNHTKFPVHIDYA